MGEKEGGPELGMEREREGQSKGQETEGGRVRVRGWEREGGSELGMGEMEGQS